MRVISYRKVLQIGADGLHLDLAEGTRGLVPIADIFVESVEPVRLSRTIYQGSLCIAVDDTRSSDLATTKRPSICSTGSGSMWWSRIWSWA
ncbi:MAG: hypothetical protein A3K19_19695 [Lentisphaerae bacterium RIFOXYB12_FULL_65_16]|nr:MAG: hypothetical protein A3K18_31120 [Lentisphaerae bacterium RIFOXYA12_64_32]OGV92087.1 MAG: hypothetical protein A3K19_19695 [Lentisphaerae bacterium RIFOXYB12_FULL_65_16]